MTRKTTLIPAVSMILLILFTAAEGSFDLLVQKWAALAGLIIIITLLFTRQGKNALKVYTDPLFFIILAYVVWNGSSMSYADVTKAAIFEFTKLLIAVAAFLGILVTTLPSKKCIQKIIRSLAVTTAFFGVLSIDAASSGPFATIFKTFMGLFTPNVQQFGVLEQGIRITGIFGNANTFAGFIALGILLCVYLVLNGENAKDRTIGIVLLSINALTYILLFSIGSIFVFLIACILMISVTRKGERLQVFMLMAETAVITIIFGAIVMRSFGDSPVLPLLAIIVNAAVLWAADTYVRKPISLKLESNLKASMATGIILILLLCGYAVAAWNVTGPMSLNSAETIMRAAYLDAGQYTLKAETEKSPTVRITSQDETDLKLHSDTTIYEGSIDKASFNVPQGSQIIKLYFTGSPEGSSLKTVICKDLVTGKLEQIKLNYKLLPENVANRLQDIGANQNMIQRTVFFEDGLKLFKKSPVIGQGISGYEEGVSSVQNFYYETKYVHNHYIQTLCDLGVIGFALYCGMLIFCILALLRIRKQGGGALVMLPLFAACILQIFGQAITDVTWSAGPFLIVTFSILALLVLTQSKAYGDDLSSEDLEQCAKEKYGDLNLKITGGGLAKILILFLSVMMSIFLMLNLYAHYRAASGNCTIDQIGSFAKMDHLESDDYKTTYIVTTSSYGLQQNMDQANQFAKTLTSNPDAALNYVLPFYFNTGQEDQLFKTAEDVIKSGKSNPVTWNKVLDIFDAAIDSGRENPFEVLVPLLGEKSKFVDNVIGYYKQLQERNATYLDDAMLNPNNVVFVGKMLGIENLDLKSLQTAVDIFAKTIFNSDFGVDVNNDRIPDNITVLSGSTKWGCTTNESKNPKEPITKDFDGTVTVEKGTSFTLQTYCVKGGEYTLRLDGLKGLDGNAGKDMTISVDGQPLAVSYDANGAFVKTTLKGAQAEDQAKGIKATAGSAEVFTLTFPTGAQINKITVTK